MTEEIKIQPTAAEPRVPVFPSPQGLTGSARDGAERNDGKPIVAWATLVELSLSKRIPPLDGVQMLALLHYLFKAADRSLRFQIAEIVYRYDHNHPNAQDLFLACILPSAEKGARRKAEKLFVHPSDWQVELMYDGAVAAAIEMFQLNSLLSSVPNAFRRYVVRGLSRGMLRSYFMREENSQIRPVGDVRAVRTRKTIPAVAVEREIIAKELLDQVTNYPNLRPPVLATLQCIAALGPDFALKEHAFTASGDPDKWKRDRDRRPILDSEAIAEAMGIPKCDVHRYLCQARVILRQAFNADEGYFRFTEALPRGHAPSVSPANLNESEEISEKIAASAIFSWNQLQIKEGAEWIVNFSNIALRGLKPRTSQERGLKHNSRVESADLKKLRRQSSNS